MPDRPATVVKLGGAVCRDPALLRMALAGIEALAASRPLLVIPGGGAFADVVRRAQQQLRFSDSTAHWMAVLAMNQVAHLIAEQLAKPALLEDPAAAAEAWATGALPVLAPYAWLRAHDSLPHSWDVTSDSIAAFVARHVGAEALLLVKATEGRWEDLVDPEFAAQRGALVVRACTPAGLRTLAAA